MSKEKIGLHVNIIHQSIFCYDTIITLLAQTFLLTLHTSIHIVTYGTLKAYIAQASNFTTGQAYMYRYIIFSIIIVSLHELSAVDRVYTKKEN